MIQNKKNLLLLKNSVSFLAIGLTTYVAMTDPCFSGKRDHAVALGDDAVANPPPKRTRLVGANNVLESYNNIFKISLSQLREAKQGNDNEMSVEAIKTLQSVATSTFHPGAAYLYGVFHRQGTFGCPENPTEALTYFSRPVENGDSEAIYEAGLCYKSLGRSNQAKESFRQVQEKHDLARVEYGTLLYDEATQLPQGGLRVRSKQDAITLLESVHTFPEAAYKLGRIYCYDTEVKDWERGILMFSHAENGLKTTVQADDWGICELSPNEIRVNAQKKKDAGFGIAQLELEVLKRNGGQNLDAHLQQQLPKVNSIKKRCKEFKELKEDDPYRVSAQNLENFIDPRLYFWQR